MGTSIELVVGGVSVDYAKNSMGNDHGALFQEGDRTQRYSDETDYEYYQQHPEEDVGDREAAFARPLRRVLPRLKLLGWTLDAARAEYEEFVREHLDSETASFMSFDEYCAFVCTHPLDSLNDTYVDFDSNDRDELAKGKFSTLESVCARIPSHYNGNAYWSEKSYFASIVRILSPYSMLQVFGQCEANADAEVVWQYGPIVDSGWVREETFQPFVARTQKILIVTEGSSDARIIRHALDILRSDVSDFFRFVDLEGSHPFWGTGNLVKFAEGLLRIDVHNSIIFLLDNDAEGVDAHERLLRLGLPPNMRPMILPKLDAFEHFPARGPSGIANCDINGRAAAIECYLDLRLPGYPPAQVQWSNYKKESQAWHGALEHKESYSRRFLQITREDLESHDYDVSKLTVVLERLLYEADQLMPASMSDTKMEA